MKTIYDRLRAYSDSDYYGFHMPGHKRRLYPMQEVNPYAIDITEIDGFDDLHHAQGILKVAQDRAARLYGADETYFLVNGSTVGILSAILGVTKKDDSILVARNCHKSVYHAIYLNELNPVYLYPRFDEAQMLNREISEEDVRRALSKYPQIRAVVIVSPTYDGVVSDVSAIAAAAHEHGVPLIVDEAHGAHFGFHPYFPENSNRLGADLVIHSVHKTLPAFTQTALLHVNGELADRSRVKRYLAMLQSSSPSYLLMAGIDQCMELLENQCEEIFEPYVEMLRKCRENLGELKHLRLLEPVGVTDYDRSKLVISVAGMQNVIMENSLVRRCGAVERGLEESEAAGIEMTGKRLYEKLIREYHIQPEMAAGTYVLAMTSVGDTAEGFERLVHALAEIDKTLISKEKTTVHASKELSSEEDVIDESKAMFRNGIFAPGNIPTAEVVMNISEAVKVYDVCEAVDHERTEGNEAMEKDQINVRNLAVEQRGSVKSLSWEATIGYISMEYAYLYPPGIPILAPGERVTKAAVEQLRWYREKDFSVEGIRNEGHLEVWIDG